MVWVIFLLLEQPLKIRIIDPKTNNLKLFITIFYLKPAKVEIKNLLKIRRF